MITKAIHISVPIELCKYALVERKTKQIGLWLFFKVNTGGFFLLNRQMLNKALEDMGYKSRKTFNKHLNWLLKYGYITLNYNTSSYRIVSFARISKKYRFVSKKSAIFHPEYINVIDGFFAAAVITYCIKTFKKGKGQSAFQKHKARKNCPYPFVTIKALSVFLGVPMTTAQRFKQKAIDSGFIKAEHQFDPLIFDPSYYNFIKSVGKEFTKNYIRGNDKILLQKPDKITSSIILCKRAN